MEVMMPEGEVAFPCAARLDHLFEVFTETFVRTHRKLLAVAFLMVRSGRCER
jgi:hypothetical protein